MYTFVIITVAFIFNSLQAEDYKAVCPHLVDFILLVLLNCPMFMLKWYSSFACDHSFAPILDINSPQCPRTVSLKSVDQVRIDIFVHMIMNLADSVLRTPRPTTVFVYGLQRPIADVGGMYNWMTQPTLAHFSIRTCQRN